MCCCACACSGSMCYSNTPIQENIEILKMAGYGIDDIQAEKHRTVDCKMWKYSVREGAVSGKGMEASQGEQATSCKLYIRKFLNPSTCTPAYPPPHTCTHTHPHTRTPSHTHTHSMWLLLMIRSKNLRNIQGLNERSFSINGKKVLGQLNRT